MSATATRARACKSPGRKRRKPTALEQKLEAVEVVSNEALRERYLFLRDTGQITANRVGLLMGRSGVDGAASFLRKPSHRPDRQKQPGRVPDSRRVDRVLGVTSTPGNVRNGRQYPATYRKHIPYEWAVAFARILGMDPHEAGV